MRSGLGLLSGLGLRSGFHWPLVLSTTLTTKTQPCQDFGIILFM